MRDHGPKVGTAPREDLGEVFDDLLVQLAYVVRFPPFHPVFSSQIVKRGLEEPEQIIGALVVFG